jgi:hypothetical protein
LLDVVLLAGLFLVQLGVAWLERAGLLPFILRCFLVLALGTWFPAKGKLALQR